MCIQKLFCKFQVDGTLRRSVANQLVSKSSRHSAVSGKAPQIGLRSFAGDSRVSGRFRDYQSVGKCDNLGNFRQARKVLRSKTEISDVFVISYWTFLNESLIMSSGMYFFCWSGWNDISSLQRMSVCLSHLTMKT